MSNTYGKLAPKIYNKGYESIPIRLNSKAPAISSWSKLVIDKKQVMAWMQEYTHGGLGIRTKFTPAIDIDIRDPVAADCVERAVFKILKGSAPVRIGKAPKRLIVCRTDTPFRKIRKEFIDKNGEIHGVEILGDGQQFVAFGIHPDTQKPYTWVAESPLDTPAKELITINATIAQQIIDAAEQELKKLGWTASEGPTHTPAPTQTDDDFAGFKQKLHITEEKIDQCLNEIPNDIATHYDTWSMVGMALWHQFDGEQEGYEKWVNWSEKGPKHNEEEMPLKWRSFAPDSTSNPVTFASVLKMATDYTAKQAQVQHETLVEKIKTAADVPALENIVKEIRKADLSPLQRDDIVNKLVKAYKSKGREVSKAAVKNDLGKKRSSAGSTTNLEIDLANQVCADHFEGGENLLYIAGLCWIYDKGVWRNCDKEFIRQRVLLTLQKMMENNDPIYRKLLQLTQDSKREDRFSALVGSVTDVVLIQRTRDSFTDPLNLKGKRLQPVVNCKNGELWVSLNGDTEFRDHWYENYLTWQMSCDYDPFADCPKFAGAIKTIFSECRDPDEVIRHWIEVMGLVFQPVRAEAMWVLMKGPGGNGKSFLMDIVSSVMGSTVYPGALADLSSRNGINPHFTAGLVGKLMFLDDDLKAGTLLPDDWMKKLSEPKLLPANPKHAKMFEFTSRAIVVALANHWPATSDISMGMKRRAQVFEMSYILPFEIRDPGLHAYILENELPGVMNMLLAGLLRVLKRGGYLSPPAECLEAKEAWLHSGNSTARFLQDCTQADPDARTNALTIYETYRAWTYESDDHIKALGRNALYAAIESEGFRFARLTKGLFVTGLKIRNGWEKATETDGF